MDNSQDQQNRPGDNHRPTEETANAEGKPQHSEGCILASVRSAMRKGAEDARTAAEKASLKVKSAAADGVYWAAYGLSFAAVFQWTLARNLAPQAMKAGCGDGIRAGRDAAERLINKLRQRKDQATASPDQAGPSPEATQPGAA